jgi:hypothetical protein
MIIHCMTLERAGLSAARSRSGGTLSLPPSARSCLSKSRAGLEGPADLWFEAAGVRWNLDIPGRHIVSEQSERAH